MTDADRALLVLTRALRRAPTWAAKMAVVEALDALLTQAEELEAEARYLAEPACQPMAPQGSRWANGRHG